MSDDNTQTTEHWILFSPDGEWEAFDCEPDGLPLRVMQHMVGGLIEYAPLNRSGNRIFVKGGTGEAIRIEDVVCNEEGRLLGMDTNVIMSLFYQGNWKDHGGGPPLVGNVLIRYVPLGRAATTEEMMASAPELHASEKHLLEDLRNSLEQLEERMLSRFGGEEE